MFEALTEKFEAIFKKLKSRGRLDEENIKAALKEIRLLLLEADVNFKVVRDFCEEIRARAIGSDVLDSITPGQQVVKIVHDRLVELLGGKSKPLKLTDRYPAPILLVGLQGSGKTTSAAKLARYLTREGRRVGLVSADVYRPAAREQLKVLARETKLAYFDQPEDNNPLSLCSHALACARKEGYDTLVIDTAGRLHIDEEMMGELKRIKDLVNPVEILFVADAMTGQEAVNVASRFHELLNIDGVILTKMDGDARGGAALSLKATLGKPVKFIGVGEKTSALEVFHPERMASRILGMGDIVSLVEKAQEAVDEQKARELERRLRKNEFTLADFRDQLTQIRKMGPLQEIIKMIPGLGKNKALAGMNVDDRDLTRYAAIIDSMTPRERADFLIIDGRRRKRIAGGSGTSIQDVNRLLKNFAEMRKMIKKFSTKEGMKSLRRGNFPF
jgi:signal recognition particle subunit SRP54